MMKMLHKTLLSRVALRRRRVVCADSKLWNLGRIFKIKQVSDVQVKRESNLYEQVSKKKPNVPYTVGV